MTREIAPLKKAEDAILVDSSDMTIDEGKVKYAASVISERKIQ